MKRLAFLFFTSILLISSWVYSNPQNAEKLERGLAWLDSQQSQDGAFYSSAGFADALQVTSESVVVLEESQNTVFDKAAATAYVQQNRQSHTESLYWKVLLNSLSQQSTEQNFEKIKLNQNRDGGFGSYQSYDSNALDSAFALKAALIAEADNAVLVGNVLSYLLQDQRDNGSFALNPSNDQSVYVTSLVLSALNPLKFHFQISAEIEKATAFLVEQINEEGSSLLAWQKAMAIIAIRQATVDATDYKSVSDILFDQQLANGSWQDDAYTTALILKSSQAVSAVEPPAVVTEAAVSGRVLDRDSGVALSGASLQLFSYETSSVAKEGASNGQGLFQLSEIPAGNYQLTVSAEGYLPATADLTLTAGANLELGSVTLAQVSDRAVVQGTVLSAEDGQPLPDVQVSIGTVTVVSDQSGFYRMNVEPGAAAIQVVLAGYQTVNATADLTAGSVTTFSPSMYLEGSQQPQVTGIQGRVIDFNSLQPVANVAVSVNGEAVATTDQDGLFSATNLVAGETVVELSATDYQPATYTATIQENATSNFGDLTLSQASTNQLTTVMGLIKDAQDGTPIGGAEIRIPEFGLTVMSGIDGKYHIEGITKTDFALEVSAVGYFDAISKFSSEVGSVVVSNFVLESSSSLGIEITNIHTGIKDKFEAYEEVEMEVAFLNLSDEERKVRLYLKVISENGILIEERPVISVPLGVSNEIAYFSLEPGVEVEQEVEWHTRNHSPGLYSLVVQAFDRNGELLIQRGKVVEILPTKKIGGHSEFSPIIAMKDNKPVEISASLTNKGNSSITPSSVEAIIELVKIGNNSPVGYEVSDLIQGGNISNALASDIGENGSLYYLNSLGTEIKVRSVDGTTSTLLNNMEQVGVDIDVDALGNVHILTYSTIIKLEKNGNINITELDFTHADKFALKDDGRYYIWNGSKLYDFEEGRPSKVIGSGNLIGAYSAVQGLGEEVYIADRSGNLFKYINGAISLYGNYSINFIKLAISSSGRIFGIEESRAAVYELLDKGQSNLMADGFDVLSDIYWEDNNIYVSDSGAGAIVKISIDGNKETVLSSKFKDIKMFSEFDDKLYGVNSNNELVQLGESGQQYISKLPHGVRSLYSNKDGLYFLTYSQIYKLESDGIYTEYQKVDYRATKITGDGEGAFYTDSSYDFPLAHSGSDTDGKTINKMPRRITAFSKSPDEDSILVIDVDEGVVKVNSDFTYEKILSVSRKINNRFILALSGGSFVVTNYMEKKLVIHDRNGALIKSIDLNFYPGNMTIGKDGQIFVSENSGNRIFLIEESGDISLFRILNGPVANGIAIGRENEVYFVGSDGKIYINDGVEREFYDPKEMPNQLYYQDNELIVTTGDKATKIDSNGYATPIVIGGSISNNRVTHIYPIFDHSYIAISDNGRMVKYDKNYQEVEVVQAIYGVRDFKVFDKNVYVLDGIGRVAVFSEPRKLPKLLFGSSGYTSIDVLSEREILLIGPNGVDKFNVDEGAVTERIIGIDASLSYVRRNSGNILVYDPTTFEVVHTTEDLVELDRYFDLSSPSFIAPGFKGDILFVQGANMYEYYENGSISKIPSINLKSATTFRYFENSGYALVVNGTVYYGQDPYKFDRSWALPSSESWCRDIYKIDSEGFGGIAQSDVITGDIDSIKYDRFSIRNIASIAVNDDIAYLSTKDRIVQIGSDGRLHYHPMQMNMIGDMHFDESGELTILVGGMQVYKYNVQNETITEVVIPLLSESDKSYFDIYYRNGSYILVGKNYAVDLKLNERKWSEGDIVFTQVIDHPTILNDASAVDLIFENWVPPVSGDYTLTISSTNPKVSGDIVNTFHVGDFSNGLLSLDEYEVLPGNFSVLGDVNIYGSGSVSISKVETKSLYFKGATKTHRGYLTADQQGNIYAGEWKNIKVMSPEGEVSSYVSGDFQIKGGMAISNDNTLYAVTNNGILKVDPDKKISFVQSLGRVGAILVGNDNVLYASNSEGLFAFYDEEKPIRIASSGFNDPRAIAQDDKGSFYVLNAGNRIVKVNPNGMVTDYYEKARFEYEGINLVSDCSNNLFYTAFYDSTSKPIDSEEDKLIQLPTDIGVSRVALDGPSFDFTGYDMDTLYYDRFGQQILIWTDWNGDGRVFSVPVVCGKIDVELHATTRTDVHAVFEQLPDQVVEIDDKQQLVWSLKDVDVDGVNIPAQFSFDNLQEGERRPVLESAFLRFKNTFDEDNPIDLPLDIPSVLAITRVNLTGHTDRSTYLPNTDVAVSLEFSNESAGPLSGEIQYGIYDQQGTAVVEFDTLAIQDQIPQQTNLIQTSWNTAETFADGYVLKAQFNNARGELVESIEYPFSIVSSDTPDTLGFSSGISTDKVLYEKGETATISTRVLNTSANTVAENLIARIRLLDVDDNVIFSFDQTVQALYPNGVHSKQTPFVLSAVSAGNYQAQLMVVDSLSGQVKDTQSYTFAVNQGGVAGSGLSGTTTATPTQVNKGQTFTCVHDITNVGTANSGLTELRSFVVRAENDELYNAVDLSSDIAAGSSETFTYQYNTLDMPLGGYACVMQANLQGQWQTLSSAGVLVREDPVLSRLTATVQAANDEVYLGEPTSCIDTVTYVADSGSTDINLIQNLVSIDSGLIIDTDSASVDLNANEGQVLSRAYGANQLSMGQYRCDLYAERSGSQRLIGQDTFTVVEPPVRVSTSLLDGQRGRLLLLTDNSRQCSALEDIHVKVNWGSEFSSETNLTVKVFNADGIVVDTEVVSQWDVEINAGQPIDDADITVQATLSGDVQVLLSAPVHKLGHQYRIEVEAQRGWFYRETKSWDLQTDCDRPFTVGEIIEDVHLLGYKWFHNPSDSVKDLDPYGPVTAPLVPEQNAFLQSQLDNRGWEYTLVHTANDFTTEMRSGDYAAYIILSERAHLPVLAQKELREHVFAGKGLVMAGSHDKRNLFVEPALGITVTGRHPWATGLLDSMDDQSEVFPFHHLIQTVSLHGANVEAEYSLIADDLSPEELQQGWENLHDAIPLLDHIRNYRRRAVMTTDYGLGLSTFMGYDVLAVATELGEQSESSDLLFNHIERVASIQPQAVAYREWPVVVTISNEGSAVTGTATLTLPEGMTLVSTGDFEQDGNVWVMSFELDEALNGASTEYQKTVYVRLPQGDGSQSINLYVEAFGANGGQADVQASLEVSSNQAATMDELTELGRTVKYNHWYEPHFYILYADLLLIKNAVENENWWAAQTLLIGASNLILLDSREDVMQLRLAIDEQIRLIGKQL